MKHGSGNRRSRNRGGGSRKGNQNKVKVFDSNGPDVRIRGTAHQVHEKYMALAKDADGAGDMILAESYRQHAEHYQRIINTYDEGSSDKRRVQDDVEADGNREEDDLDALPAAYLPSSVAKTETVEGNTELESA